MAKFAEKPFIIYEGEQRVRQLVMPSMEKAVFVPTTPYVGYTTLEDLQVGINIGDWEQRPLEKYDMEFPDLLMAFAAMQLLNELSAIPEGAAYKAWEVVRLGTDEMQRQRIRESDPKLLSVMEAVSMERLREIKGQIPPDLDKAVKQLVQHSVRFAAKPIIELIVGGKLQLDNEIVGRMAIRSAKFP